MPCNMGVSLYDMEGILEACRGVGGGGEMNYIRDGGSISFILGVGREGKEAMFAWY